VLRGATRPALQTLGIPGEVIETPGHSADSVSLVLDSGLCFIGDLHPPQFVADEAAAALTRASWKTLLDHGAKEFYPAHGEVFKADVVESAFTD
jgi:glyoxylase-like metal-dependent hydrolase (beta-lactamase superfamily II)